MPLLLLLFMLTTQLVAQQPVTQPEKLTCTLEQGKSIMRCTSEDREGFPLEKRIKTPRVWTKHLGNAQDGSVLEVDAYSGTLDRVPAFELCLMRVFEQPFQPESVNGELPINECVVVKKGRR